MRDLTPKGYSVPERPADVKRMSTHLEQSLPLESLPNGVLLNLLCDLEAEEQALSSRRRALHEQIDAVQARHDESPGDLDLLGDLQRQERELSEERLQVHMQIARFRIERGNRVRGLRAQLRAV